MAVDFKFHPHKKATIILAPFNGGQPKGGVEEGPEHIVKHGLPEQLKLMGWDVTIDEPLLHLDLEALKKDPNDVHEKVKRPNMVSTLCELIHDSVAKAAKNGTLPLTLGGDHSIAIGTVSGFLSAHPDACLLWIDAHADINTITTTESGNLHGCPVSFLLGLDRDLWPPQFNWLKPVLGKHRLAYIGLRDVEAGERQILRENGICAYSMYHVDKFGIGEVVKRALLAINPTGESPIHVSYDVDAIDPLYVPATGTPVRGGLTLREGMYIVEEVAASGNLAALDVVETNPSLSVDHIGAADTVSAASAIARCALGETLL